MKHADSLAVARKRGTLLLQGRVLFVHDSIQFRTQRATWNKDAEMVQCTGGFLFTHPSGFIQADNGIYRKKQSIAIASGNVIAGDSASSYKFTGDYLEYDRENEVLTMPQKPKLYQYEKHKDNTTDTLTIEARKIIYNKKFSFAEAYKDVKVTEKDMVVTCDTGYFDRANSWLSMKGHPTFDMKNYHLTGDSIYLTIDENKKTLTSALVIRNAHGISKEDPKKNAPGNVTEAFGDTLYCEFKDNKIERLYVNLNAKGFFYETDLPDYRNLMDGNRLDMYFKKGKMDHAVVSGKAQSTYFYVKKDRTVSGKNEAAGDTINIVFDPLKNAVKTLRLLGRSTIASGRYVDLEKEQREKAAKEKADTTLTKLRGGNDKKERRKPSALRPSMNKMIKRAKETKRKEEESP
jgi:lipopolysaccharide export system protein LptA